MALELDLSITMTDCCDTLQICDTTCEDIVCNTSPCTTGYGVGGNIFKRDIARTEFSFVFPDGSSATSLDFGWIPGNKAYSVFELATGTTGDITVRINAIPIGYASFTVDLPTTTLSLINSINANTGSTGWRAFLDPIVNTRVIVESVNSGVAFNGLAFDYILSGDFSANNIVNPTEGGTDNSDCLDLTLADIYLLNGATILNNNEGPNYKDGVYTVTYVVYDNLDVEVARIEKHFLVDCNAVSCLKESLLTTDGCGCNEAFDERILRTRLKIEQASIQFNEGLYDCANETIIKAGDMCSDVCVDC